MLWESADPRREFTKRFEEVLLGVMYELPSRDDVSVATLPSRWLARTPRRPSGPDRRLSRRDRRGRVGCWHTRTALGAGREPLRSVRDQRPERHGLDLGRGRPLIAKWSALPSRFSRLRAAAEVVA